MNEPLQRRGQFFVRNIGVVQRDVPVDNLIFISSDKREEVKLEAHGRNVFLVSWQRNGGEPRLEYFESYAFGLRRMANILEGKVRYEGFGPLNHNNTTFLV
jgi:hypothetical protein